MANTILNQIITLFSIHGFGKLAKTHHVGQKFRSFNRWSQLLAMMIAQISGRRNLRDIITNLDAKGRLIYH